MPVASLSYLRPEVAELKQKIDQFVEQECIPAELEFEEHLKGRHGRDRWTIDAIPPCIDRLKQRAKDLGLWNLFLPEHLAKKISDPSLTPPIDLSYREYAVLCESLGRSVHIAPEACNCSAPDTGNMEVLMEFGTAAQKSKYLIPLLRGEMRSTFLMTEPNVASSDPTNLETRLLKLCLPDGKTKYVLSGRKWWSTGAIDPRCRLALVVARMDYSDSSCKSQSVSHNDPNIHGSHTIVAVSMPHPGVHVKRALKLFGYDDAPRGHAEVVMENVVLDESDLILGEGSGFQVSQARLGPGRIHHCMRAIGMAARCYELMLRRTMERKTFGKYLWEHGGCREMIADSATDLEAARLLTLSCAAAMDEVGVRSSRDKIAMIKVAVPELTYRVVDRAVQIFGGAGVSDDHVMAGMLVGLRSLRIADGPDAVHKQTIALLELKKTHNLMQKQETSRL